MIIGWDGIKNLQHLLLDRAACRAAPEILHRHIRLVIFQTSHTEADRTIHGGECAIVGALDGVDLITSVNSLNFVAVIR